MKWLMALMLLFFAVLYASAAGESFLCAFLSAVHFLLAMAAVNHSPEGENDQ